MFITPPIRRTWAVEGATHVSRLVMAPDHYRKPNRYKLPIDLSAMDSSATGFSCIGCGEAERRGNAHIRVSMPKYERLASFFPVWLEGDATATIFSSRRKIVQLSLRTSI